jgi:hypothetical protein
LVLNSKPKKRKYGLSFLRIDGLDFLRQFCYAKCYFSFF